MIFVTILLTILKITGLVLAGIIGLALLLVLWILLSPIRYKGRIKYSGKPDIRIKASYLCHIFQGILYWMRMDKRRILKYSGKACLTENPGRRHIGRKNKINRH